MHDLTDAPTQIKMVDPDTDRPLFQTRCIELACEACISDGKGHECVHHLHLVPQWQSAERHRKLRVMMQDRPDLIQRYSKHTSMVLFIHVSLLMTMSRFLHSPLAFIDHQTVFLIINPVSVPTHSSD
jgi:hypothetical protein